MWLLVLTLLTGTLTSAQTRVLVERYNQAQLAVVEENHHRAAGLFQSLVRDYGRSEFGDELRFALAESYFNLGQFARARDVFQHVVAHPHHNYIKPEAMYGVAISSIMLGHHEQARLALEDLTRQGGYDRDDRVNFAFGVLHYFREEYEQAEARLSGLPMSEAKFYLAKCHAVQGRPLPALLTLKEVTVAVPNTPLATMAHFAAGQALFINHDHDGARAKFQFFVDEFPYSPLVDYAHYFLGCALIAQKKYAAAVGHLMPLTRNSNNYLAAHANYFIGYANMALGQPEDAVERYQRVRANFPKTKIASFANLQLSQAMLATADTAQTLLSVSQLAQMFKTGELSGVGNYLSGVILYQTGEYKSAADQFELIIMNYAETSLREPACAMLLLSLNTSGAFEKVVAIGAKYVADYPDESSEWRAKTLHFLAEGFYYYGKYDEADAYYKRAYTHSASSDVAPYARLGRSFCLYHLGRLGEATGGFQGLLNARTSDTLFTISAYLGYGYSIFNQGEDLKALDVFEALANTFPDDPLAAIPGHFYAGYCYQQLEYYGQAVDAWTVLMNKFPENNPKVAEAAFRTGDIYFKAIEYDKAVAAFNFVVERHPSSEYAPPSQALIAQCYYNRRQYLDAVREYQKFLDLYPSDEQGLSVRKSMEMSYYLAGAEDSVVREEFLKRFPQSEMAAEGQYEKGKALFDAGNYDDAAFELQKTVVNFPGSPLAGDAQLLTAEAYAQAEKWDRSAAAYRKFLDYFPDHSQAAGAWFNMATALFNLGDYQRSLEAFRTVAKEYPESEYVESALQNAEVCSKRLGAGVVEEHPPVSGDEPDEQPGSGPPTEGGQQ